jgi:hypothetical protein
MRRRRRRISQLIQKGNFLPSLQKHVDQYYLGWWMDCIGGCTGKSNMDTVKTLRYPNRDHRLLTSLCELLVKVGNWSFHLIEVVESGKLERNGKIKVSDFPGRLENRRRIWSPLIVADGVSQLLVSISRAALCGFLHQSNSSFPNASLRKEN